MKSTMWIGTAVVCMSVSLAAQNPPTASPTPQAPTSPPQTSTAGTKAPSPSSVGQGSGQTVAMTVTGCLQRAEPISASGAPRSAGDPGTSGGVASGIRNDAEQFALTNITNRAVSGNATSASAPAIAAESTYLLRGQTDDLRAHVGHQVEITAIQIAMPQNNQGDVRPGTAVGTSGTAQPASPGAAAAGTTGTPETAANPDTSKGVAAGQAKMPTALMVQSVRMLAATCSPAAKP